MRYKTFLSYFAVPLSLSAVLILGSMVIHNGWNYQRWSFVVLLILYIAIAIMERIIPLRKEWLLDTSNLRTEIFHLVFSVAVFDALGKAMALWMVLWVKTYLVETSQIWQTLPFWFVFVLANIVGEFLPYWYHRISHVGKPGSVISLFLWKIHAIHHLPSHLNWLKSNWIHPINMLINTFLKAAPLLMLGFSEDIIFMTGLLHIIIAYLSHANIKTNTGWLDYLIVTPRLHQFHHSKDLNEAKNYGNILPFWDLVFGTFYIRNGDVNEVGTAKASYSYPHKRSYFDQMLYPVSALKTCCQDTDKRSTFPDTSSETQGGYSP